MDYSNLQFNYCDILKLKTLQPLPCGDYDLCFNHKCEHITLGKLKKYAKKIPKNKNISFMHTPKVRFGRELI